MSASPTDLYQTILLDHARRPRHRSRPPRADRVARGENPACGDQCEIALRLDPASGTLAELGFTGAGCAISQASASILCTLLQGRPAAELATRFAELRHIMETGEPGEAPPELAAFAGVRAYPARVKCASLAWHAATDALAAPLTDHA
jgi:nitrogen fixation protein NifU and related proteins